MINSRLTRRERDTCFPSWDLWHGRLNGGRPPMVTLIVLGAICFGIAPTRPAWGQFGGPASVQVERVKIEEVAAGQEFVGTVVPVRTAIIGSAVDGRVIDFPVNEGDRVEADQPLAQLLTQTIELELQAAEAQLRLRRQELEQLERSHPEELEQARARRDAARACSGILRRTTRTDGDALSRATCRIGGRFAGSRFGFATRRRITAGGGGGVYAGEGNVSGSEGAGGISGCDSNRHRR